MFARDNAELHELADLSPELLDALIAEAEAGPDPQEFTLELVQHRDVRVMELAELSLPHAL
jgi:hypothetical protein